MYYDLGADAIVRVYRDNKPINFFASIKDARVFIKEEVERLNDTEV